MVVLASALLCIIAPAPPHQSSTYPQAVREQPAPEFVDWIGFKYLAKERYIPTSIPVTGDWSTIDAPAINSRTTAIPWTMRLFVLRRVDRVLSLSDGTQYEEKCSLESPDIDRISRSVDQLKALVGYETKGKVSLQVQVSTDDSPLLLGGRTLEQALLDYTTPRVNGGAFAAEDHLDRGPYQCIVCIHPVPSPSEIEGMVNHMPFANISAYGFSGYEAEGMLALELHKTWLHSVRVFARRTGVLGPLRGVAAQSQGSKLSNPLQYVPSEDWLALTAGEDLNAADIDARLRLPVTADAPTPKTPLLSTSYKGISDRVSIETDAEKGPILRVSEKGEARNGGLCLPASTPGADIMDSSKTPTLDVTMRSDSKDPLQLEFVSQSGKSSAVCLGRDLPGPNAIFQADLPRDGAWHSVKIDLKRAGVTDVEEIRLVPTANSHLHPKITLGPIRYDFASFEATTEAPDAPLPDLVPEPQSADPWARANWARAAKPSAPLRTLLKDPDWMVRLNALQPFIASRDPEAEPLLTENATIAIDGPVAAAAADALWKLGSDSAKAVIHQVITTGLTEQGKAECAMLLASTKDTAIAPELIVLQQTRSLQTRMAAVDALAQFPGANAAVIRMSFIYQDDPQLKLEVTRTSDPDDSYQWRKLLWSAVNEGSDAVRLESYKKLVSSNDETAREAGLAGVKDDSVQVRVELIEFLAAHPRGNYRVALLQALTDRSARVKAAALEAFAAMDKQAKIEELEPAMRDAHPIVQVALIHLAAKAKLTLPANVITALSESPDPEVKAALPSLKAG